MISVIKAKYINNYRIEIMFSDNLKGVIDLENTIKNDDRKIFQELKDREKFSKIKLGMETIIWNNGLDLAPEFLYELLLKQNKQK